MNEHQRDIWHRLVEARPTNLWFPIDAPMVAVLAGATSDMLIISNQLTKHLADPDADPKILKLYGKLQDETSDLVLKLSRSLYATPLARSEGRVSWPKEGPVASTVPAADLGEVLRLLSLGERLVLASHARAQQWRVARYFAPADRPCRFRTSRCRGR